MIGYRKGAKATLAVSLVMATGAACAASKPPTPEKLCPAITSAGKETPLVRDNHHEAVGRVDGVSANILGHMINRCAMAGSRPDVHDDGSATTLTYKEYIAPGDSSQFYTLSIRLRDGKGPRGLGDMLGFSVSDTTTLSQGGKDVQVDPLQVSGTLHGQDWTVMYERSDQPTQTFETGKAGDLNSILSVTGQALQLVGNADHRLPIEQQV